MWCKFTARRAPRCCIRRSRKCRRKKSSRSHGTDGEVIFLWRKRESCVREDGSMQKSPSLRLSNAWPAAVVGIVYTRRSMAGRASQTANASSEAYIDLMKLSSPEQLLPFTMPSRRRWIGTRERWRAVSLVACFEFSIRFIDIYISQLIFMVITKYW